MWEKIQKAPHLLEEHHFYFEDCSIIIRQLPLGRWGWEIIDDSWELSGCGDGDVTLEQCQRSALLAAKKKIETHLTYVQKDLKMINDLLKGDTAMNGKGSSPRPRRISGMEFENRWNATFAHGKQSQSQPQSSPRLQWETCVDDCDGFTWEQMKVGDCWLDVSLSTAKDAPADLYSISFTHEKSDWPDLRKEFKGTLEGAKTYALQTVYAYLRIQREKADQIIDTVYGMLNAVEVFAGSCDD